MSRKGRKRDCRIQGEVGERASNGSEEKTRGGGSNSKRICGETRMIKPTDEGISSKKRETGMATNSVSSDAKPSKRQRTILRATHDATKLRLSTNE